MTDGSYAATMPLREVATAEVEFCLRKDLTCLMASKASALYTRFRTVQCEFYYSAVSKSISLHGITFLRRILPRETGEFRNSASV